MKFNLTERVRISHLVNTVERILEVGYPAITQISQSVGPHSECPIIMGIEGLPGKPEVIYVVVAYNATNLQEPLQGYASNFDIITGDGTAKVIRQLEVQYSQRG